MQLVTADIHTAPISLNDLSHIFVNSGSNLCVLNFLNSKHKHILPLSFTFQVTGHVQDNTKFLSTFHSVLLGDI